MSFNGNCYIHVFFWFLFHSNSFDLQIIWSLRKCNFHVNIKRFLEKNLTDFTFLLNNKLDLQLCLAQSRLAFILFSSLTAPLLSCYIKKLAMKKNWVAEFIKGYGCWLSLKDVEKTNHQNCACIISADTHI